MKKVLVYIAFGTMGDILSATPIVRKLYQVYERKITVASRMDMIFKDNPYVDEHIEIHNTSNPTINNNFTDDLLSKYEDDYVIHKIGVSERNEDSTEDFFRHIRHMTLTNYMASQIGMHLMGSDHELDFFPTKVDIRDELNIPKKYVCLNISRNGLLREWDIKNFQKLIDLLNEIGIYVVCIGKSMNVDFHTWCNPHLYRDGVDTSKFNDVNIDIKYGINLFDKTNLDEVWDIIHNSKCFVTMDSGLLHLAGTTDTHIIQLGGDVNPIFRTPYRNASQFYKYSHIAGECTEFCASNLKYSVRNFGNARAMLVDGVCYEFYDNSNFKCHSDVNKVFKKCKEIVK
tara:strand:- start:158 stop:1186 length:1029 start_codon:yes stop_codon:yes gene_type:complete